MELCYSWALPTWLLDWFQFGIQSMKGSAWASGCIAERIETFLATKSVQFMSIFKLNDCEDVCVFVFADIFNLMETQRGRVLEVTSWITSFRLCCIITSSAVINSDVPTGKRRCVLHCYPRILLNTHI